MKLEEYIIEGKEDEGGHYRKGGMMQEDIIKGRDDAGRGDV